MSQREKPHVSSELSLPRVQGGQSAEQSTGRGEAGRSDVRGAPGRALVSITVAPVLSGGPAGRPRGLDGLGGGDGKKPSASGPTLEAGSVEFLGGWDK